MVGMDGGTTGCSVTSQVPNWVTTYGLAFKLRRFNASQHYKSERYVCGRGIQKSDKRLYSYTDSSARLTSNARLALGRMAS